MSHVTDQDFRKLTAGELDFASRRRVLRHLFSGCAACQDKTAGLLSFLEKAEIPPPQVPAADEQAYDAAAVRVIAALPGSSARIRREIKAREKFLDDLRSLRLPFDEILVRLEKSGLPTRARAEILLTLSFEERARSPWKMLQLAAAARITALATSTARDSKSYSRCERADLQARVWGELANAYRVNEKLPQAEDALVQADIARTTGSSDPLIYARLLDILASLRTDQRRYREAQRLLTMVIELYREVGETHLAGRALISQGSGLFYDGKPREAAELYKMALLLLDAQRDPQLVANARHALLIAMAASGDYAEAATLLLKSGLREAFADEPVSYLKVRWLEGRIYAGLSKLGRASTAFSEARQSFLNHGLDYEAALVGLEYAAVLLGQGRLGEVETLATEALEIFEMLEIQPEAVRAVSYLQRVCVARRATVELVREVVSFLERLERRPELRFFY